jgi:predicted flap endonuclease-1-like 5' DNA nuclease
MSLAIYENVNPTSRSTAVWEILIMLGGAFVLGYLLRWLMCNNSSKISAAMQTSTPKAFTAKPVVTASKKDDLKIVEGIGPKIEELLNADGITSFADLASAPVSKLKAILEAAGSRFQMHDPSSWPEQSSLAEVGNMQALQELKDRLTAGR